MKLFSEKSSVRYDVILGLLFAFLSSPALAQIQFDTAPPAAEALPPRHPLVATKADDAV